MSIAELDPQEREKADCLAAFFSGGIPDCVISDIGHDPEIAAYKQHVADDIEAQMNALMAETDELNAAIDGHIGEIGGTEAVTPPVAAPESLNDDEPTYERIDHMPTLTPYDKARARLEEAEVWRDLVEQGCDEYHQAMSDIAEAKRALKVAVTRDADPVYRQRRAIDVHRAGDGREEYNASRRERKEPNARRKDMTPEERSQHDLDMGAKRVWMSKKRKAGWTEDKITAELQIWWAKRRAKRAGAVG